MPVSGGVELRPAREEDVDRCGAIVFEGFRRIAQQGGFPLYHAGVEGARRLVSSRIRHPAIFGVVAESGAQIVGCNFLDQRGPVVGVGPITVDPAWQGHGIGRRLMEAVLERAQGAASIRLLQDAHNPVSLALYASLGFDVKDITVQVSGQCHASLPPGVAVRPLGEDDLGECATLHERVHGYERTRELRDALHADALCPVVALRAGHLVAYASTFAPWQAAFGVAETEQDMRALIAGAAARSGEPPAFLLPVRQGELLRWCLRAGLRPIRPMTYMVLGAWRAPEGTWFPSVLY